MRTLMKTSPMNRGNLLKIHFPVPKSCAEATDYSYKKNGRGDSAVALGIASFFHYFNVRVGCMVDSRCASLYRRVHAPVSTFYLEHFLLPSSIILFKNGGGMYGRQSPQGSCQPTSLLHSLLAWCTACWSPDRGYTVVISFRAHAGVLLVAI